MLKNFASVTAYVTPLLQATVSDFRIDKYLNDFSEECSFIEGTNDGAANEIELVDVGSQSSHSQMRLMRTAWNHSSLDMKFMNCTDSRKLLHLIYDTAIPASFYYYT